jgi:predicted nucleic acid-binding protein
MIFIDSNIPMYLVGASHPHKVDAQHLIERLLSEDEKLVTDAEVFQEILHRYVAIDRKDAIAPAFGILLELSDEVLPIDGDTVVRAKEIVLRGAGVSARDAIHLAVMARESIDRILTFDRGFDRHPGVRRIV